MRADDTIMMEKIASLNPILLDELMNASLMDECLANYGLAGLGAIVAQ